MGVAVFALIFLSSSYLFLRRWNITRPHAFRWDGHALHFSVVAAALALVVEADLLRVQVELSGPAGAYVTAKLTNLLATFATDKKLETLGATALWSVPIAVECFNPQSASKAFFFLEDSALPQNELLKRTRRIPSGDQHAQYACHGHSVIKQGLHRVQYRST